MIDIPGGLRRSSTPEIKIDRFGGSDYSTVATQIAKNRAEEMINCLLDKQGMLQQIPGYSKAISGTVSAGTTPVQMLTRNNVTGKFLKSHGGKIYKFTPGQAEEELYGPVADAKMKDFVMGAYHYFMNGTDYLQWNGISAIALVESGATIPTTVIGRLPSGGGTPFEPVNMLQPLRRNSFRGDGSSTIYYLDVQNLDATQVTAVVAGVSIVEGAGLTVNRTTGAVTFTVAPADSLGIDNVIILFGKTVIGYANRIKNCTFFAFYGIGNNLRVFMSGNPNYKNYDWYSAMQDPSYFPDTNYTKIGSEGVAIKGYALQQGAMHIIKEDSTYDPTIWTRTVEENVDGTIYFSVRQNASSIGLIATESIKAVDDINMILSKNGIYKVTATYISDERGLVHISDTLDSKLLKEANLKDAVAFDFEGRYGLAINDYIYIVDYINGETYRWKGIKASCFMEYDMHLYFGSRESGMVYVFNKFDDPVNLNTFDGEQIESEWRSKMFYMDRANYYKMIDNIAVTEVPISTRNNVDIYIRTNKRTEKLIKKVPVTRFNIDDIDLNDFSVLVSDLPQTVNREVNLSDIIYFQIILKNSDLGKGMAVSNITIPYSYAGEI